MTENEASNKWCPAVRFTLCELVLYDNRGGSNGHTTCNGSECMAWRWIDDGKEYQYTEPTEEGWKFDPYIGAATLESHKRWSKVKADRSGYCGLGGFPQ